LRARAEPRKSLPMGDWPAPSATSWTDQWTAALRGCVGKIVASTRVHELAIYGPDEAPYFSDPQLPFAQAMTLEINFTDGTILHVLNTQDDESFPLWPSIASEQLSPKAELLALPFRLREMNEFPKGEISAIDWSLDDDDRLQNIQVRIGAETVILCAGEVYEDWDASLTVRTDDESVLIFLDADAYRQTVFDRPVYAVPEARRT